jgi:hypothetical protein
MSRASAFLAAFLCWVGVAAAQPAAAPTTHPGTKLNFPPTLGGATFMASFNHGNAVSYKYLAGKVQLTVQIFDSGRRVPAGSASPAVVSEFTAEMAEAEQQARAGGLTGFEKPAAPASCSYGAVAFRCTVYSAQSGNGRVYGKFLLTGYRDSYLKIIAEWTQADGTTLGDADKALAAFVPALLQ